MWLIVQNLYLHHGPSWENSSRKAMLLRCMADEHNAWRRLSRQGAQPEVRGVCKTLHGACSRDDADLVCVRVLVFLHHAGFAPLRNFVSQRLQVLGNGCPKHL